MYSLRPIRILAEKHTGDQLINVSAQKVIIIIPVVVWPGIQFYGETIRISDFPKFKNQKASPSGRLVFFGKRLVCSRAREQSFLTPPLYSFETFKFYCTVLKRNPSLKTQNPQKICKTLLTNILTQGFHNALAQRCPQSAQLDPVLSRTALSIFYL